MDQLPAANSSWFIHPAFPRASQLDQLNGQTELTRNDWALVSLGRELQERAYQFVTVTPATHARVNGRSRGATVALADVFGWSLPFHYSDLPETMVRLLHEAGVLEITGANLRSKVRYSTLDGQLFVHSAFPTGNADSVFFGPDTYRFARFIKTSLDKWQGDPPARVIDIGAGSGAGGLCIARRLGASSVLLTDINAQALRFCRINIALNNIEQVHTRQSDLFADVVDRFDLIVSNPPYLIDPRERLYRHGGGELGAALSLEIATQGIAHLAPGGRLLLYTGSAIVAGVDKFRDTLHALLSDRGIRFRYEEIDPDVFGEELDEHPYNRADRICAVGVTIEAEGE